MNFFKSATVTFMTQVVLLPLGMISGIILARALGPSGRGVYAMVFLVPNMITTFIGLGTASSLIYLLGKKKYALGQIVGYAILMALALGFIGIAVFWIIYPIIRPSLKDVSPGFLVLSVTCIPFMLLNNYFSGILLSLGKAIAYNIIKIFETMTMLVGMLAAWFFMDLKIIHVVWITVFTTIIIALIYLIQIYKHTKLQIYWSKSLFRDSLTFGLKMYLNGMLASLNYRVDMFIMGYLLGATEIGYYIIAVGWSEMLWMLTNSLAVVFFPRISNSTLDEANYFTPLVCRNLLLISFPVAVGLSIGSTILGPLLYGQKFAASIVPMYWIMPGIWIFSIVKILSSDLSGRGKPELNLIPLGIATIANIPLNFLLVPILGVNGASLSSTLSYTISSIIIMVIFTKVSGVSIRKVIIPQGSDWQLYRAKLEAGLKTVKKLLQLSYHPSI
jgi:O-antigen/teichoic acid export membrane protein